MTIYDLKPSFQNLLRVPLVIRLFNAGINTTKSLAAMFPLPAYRFHPDPVSDPRLFLLLPPVLLSDMALNAIDGMLAANITRKAASARSSMNWAMWYPIRFFISRLSQLLFPGSSHLDTADPVSLCTD